MKRLFFLLLLATFIVGAAYLIQPASATTLPVNIDVKVDGHPGIYYIDATGVRHAYPDMGTYRSWRPEIGNKIAVFTQAQLEATPEGEVTRVKTGSLVKFSGRSGVYRSDSYKLLCYVTSTAMADRIYGIGWRGRVFDTILPYDYYNNIGACREPWTMASTFIRVRGVDIPLNRSFFTTSTVQPQGYEFALIGVNADKSIDLSYSKNQLGQRCMPVPNAGEADRETVNIPLGRQVCVYSNSCDGGDKVCFTTEPKESIINLNWEVLSWTAETN